MRCLKEHCFLEIDSFTGWSLDKGAGSVGGAILTGELN